MKKVFILMILMFYPLISHGELVPEIDIEKAFAVNNLAVSQDGLYIYASVADGTVRTIDATSGIELRSTLFNKSIKSISYSKGKLLVSAGNIYILDPHTGSKVILDSPIEEIEVIASDRTGLNAVGASGKNLIFYNLTSGKSYLSIRTPSEIYALSSVPVLRSWITGGKDGKIRLYSMDSGKLTDEYNTDLGVIKALSASNKTITAGGEQGAMFLDIETGKITYLSRHTDEIRSVSTTPDGKYAITGGDDNIPVIWNLHTLEAENGDAVPPLPINAVAVDPYFRYIATASGKDYGILKIQYTSNKAQIRTTFFYKNASLTINKSGYAAGTGLFGKYLYYRDDKSGDIYFFNDVSDIVNKPEELVYPINATHTKTAHIDTAPPVISVNERGFMEVNDDDILIISGNIIDDSGVEWAKTDGKPLSLDKNGDFLIEVAKSKKTLLTISAADIYGNYAEKVIRISKEDNNEKVKKTALLIGINNYEHLPSLRTPEYDVKILAHILNVQYGYEVRMMIGRHATRDAIMTELNYLKKTSGKNDTILLYYAGHGYMDRKTSNAYWQPYDSEVDNDTKWLLTSHTASILYGSNSDNIIIIADSCYSGVAEKIKGGGKSVILISSGGDEPVSDISLSDNHSVFAGALLNALKTSKIKDSQELFKSIKNYFPSNVKQTPYYIKLSGEKAEL